VRPLIVTEFVTLDGVMEAPGGEPGHPHSGWVMDFMGDEHLEYKLKEVLDADAHLLGRITYESFAGAWPEREGPMAEKLNSMPKYVHTTTLGDDDLEWNNSKANAGDVAEEVGKLKDGNGGPILVAGSRTLVQALLADDLVDELRLMVFPVVLGSGKKLFPESTEKKPFDLVDSKSFSTGVQVNTYRPKDERSG
jgi:dihydrofolate reductase